jgi:hypothetical protein
MEAHVREWKIRRALVRGALQGEGEDVQALRTEAKKHRSEGFGWFVDGFDDVETSEILTSLSAMGIQTSEDEFRSFADELPGPHEIAEKWSAQAQLTDPRQVELPWLAARTLWARWLGDKLSLETATDSLEAAIAEFEGADGARKGDGALVPIRRLIALSEGEREVAFAIADELPFRLWAWILEVLRDTRDAADLAGWRDSVEALAILFPSEPVLRLVHARFLAHHGAKEEARAEIGAALAGNSPESYQLCHASEAHLALGEPNESLAHAEAALLLADDEDDDREASGILRRALVALDREAEHGSRVEALHAQRRRDVLARRKQRRKQERKKGKRRR